MFGGRCPKCCLCFWCTLVIAVTSLSYLFGVVRRKRNLSIVCIYTLGSHVFGVDFPQSRCLPIRCSKGRRLVGTECKSVIQKARGLSYTMTLSFEVFISYHNMDKVNSSSSLLANFSVEEVLKTAVVRKMPLLYSDAYAMVAHVTTHQTVSVSNDGLALPVDDHRVEGNEEKDMYFEENTMSKAEAVVNANLTHANEEDISKVSINWGNVILWLEFVITRDVAREEVESTALRLANEDWHVTCEETHVRLVPALRDRLYGRDTVISNTSASPSETKIAWENVSSREYKDFWTQTDRTTVTVSPFLLCPSLTFSWEDFIVNDTQNEMSKVTIFNVSISLSRSQYRVDNNGRLELCRKTFIQEYFLRLTGGRNKTRKHKMQAPLMVIIEGYLSLTCVCLSLVSLMATLMTYTFFPSLRTLPGKNVMALCSNLFVAQALLQFGIRLPQQEEVCVVVGMLVHYSWLAALLWMNVCSFHMRRVFTTMQVSRTSDTSHCCTRRFAGYLVYAQGVPLLIVGATAAGSILVSRGHEVGYGRRSVGYDGHVCYLSTPFLVGVAFVVPLALVIVINLILFLQAVRSITHDAPVLRHRGGKAAKTGQQRGKDKGGRWAGRTRSEESSGVNTLVHAGSGAVYNTGSYMHKDVNGARKDGQTGGLQNRENVTGREERREGEGNEGDSCLVGRHGIDGRRKRVDTKSTREHSGSKRQLKHGRRIKRGSQEAGYKRGYTGLGFKEDEDGGSGCEECERGKCGPAEGAQTAAQRRRPDARDCRRQEQEVEPMLKVDNGHVSAAKFKAVPSFWRRNLNVCVRLSSLTGLFWTLGLLAEVLNLPVLRLVSVVANGSQGVLIAASYLPTRRVGRLYRHACSTCCLGPSKTTSNSQPVSNASTKNSSATPSGINTASTGVGSTDHSSHGNRRAKLLP